MRSCVLRAPIRDEGNHAAVYPYEQHKVIAKAEDCRPTVLDETLQLESEFGRPVVEPLYKLLWTLNDFVQTSHTAVAPKAAPVPPQCEGARDFVAVDIVCVQSSLTGVRGSGNYGKWFDRDGGDACADELCRILVSVEGVRNTDGWYIAVGPCVMTYPPTLGRGFGCELIIGGAANGRSEAAERWSRAVSFVDDALHSLRQWEGAATSLIA